jgi:hypothetical protein
MSAVCLLRHYAQPKKGHQKKTLEMLKIPWLISVNNYGQFQAASLLPPAAWLDLQLLAMNAADSSASLSILPFVMYEIAFHAVPVPKPYRLENLGIAPAISWRAGSLPSRFLWLCGFCPL